jgi:CheY-like chemotaxis protein
MTNERFHVVVVDDDPVIRDALERAELARLSLRLLERSRAQEEIIERVRQHAPHLLAPVIIFKPELENFDSKRVWIDVRLGPDGPQQKLVSYVVNFVPVALPAPSALFFKP